MAEKSKPTLLYYDILKFQGKTLSFINQHFHVIALSNPDEKVESCADKVQALFAPMEYLFDKKMMDHFKDLKVIGTPTTGLVHIDVDHAKKKDIRICSLNNKPKFLATITPTAELAWGLIIVTTRKILHAFDSVCGGKWDGKYFGKQTPRMLSSMSLGIIGLGRLGSWVARYAKAFRMKVFYYDPYVEDIQYRRCKSLQELAKVSDVLSVHVHLNDETRHMVDRKFIHTMPKGSFIINTARGGIVDEGALLEALKNGHLAGAGLDMLEGEHLPGFREGLNDHPLINHARTHDNLILTPKIGGCTVDAWEITEIHVVESMVRELEKRGLM
ncbi:D-3-phosphoglycerate dehydrogenase (EC [Olavius sp. associated proteobacterium Delta 1]|nr:D-3-phosphoglycerate dehydrogenase (EC [Olavius sp. associated proteobacterium Delta 1]